jgi:hypothetical protein
VATPHEKSESVRVEHTAGVMPVGAVDALAKLRSLFDNDELTRQIPAELRRAGFARVLFSPTQQEDVICEDSDPSPPTSTGAARLTVPVFAWRRPVGQLHVGADPASLQGNPMLLRLLAEAVGAIFERNVLAERLRTANSAAHQHIREINLLSETFVHLEQ